MTKKAHKEQRELANVWTMTAQAVEAGWSNTVRLIVVVIIVGAIITTALALIPYSGIALGVLITVATIRKVR